MATPSCKAVVEALASSRTDVQDIRALARHSIRNYDWEVCIAYQFIRVETAQNRTLYQAACEVFIEPRRPSPIRCSTPFTSLVLQFLALVETISKHHCLPPSQTN